MIRIKSLDIGWQYDWLRDIYGRQGVRDTQMNGNANLVAFEVAGPMALFTRPDTGSTPISYPVPTCPAVKGMLESVAWLRSAYYRPLRVEICSPIRFERYVTNYGGPLRKNDQVKKANNYQLNATVLIDVKYRIFAETREKRSSVGQGRTRYRPRRGKTNSAVALAELFHHRLFHGQSFYTPCLGWKEFIPSYFGPLREDSHPDTEVNEIIPSLLHSMWEHRKLRPTFVQGWQIVNGVMSYQTRRPDDVE